MKQRILRDWNFARLLRLVLGILITGQGIADRQGWVILAGSLFVLMPLFNVGCCGVGSCSVPHPGPEKKDEEVTYEEIR